MVAILGRYKNLPVERIDEFDTKREAEKMLAEYRMAFGPDFRLWLEEEPQESPCAA